MVSSFLTSTPRSGCWLRILIVAPPLLIYLYQLPPTVTYGGDCGELAAGAYTLGNVHPTGYPLYLLTARLAAFLPFGEIAWRTTLVSWLGAALTLGWTLALLHRRNLPAVALATGVWGTAIGYVFWSQSVITEVYTLHLALVAGGVVCLLEWERTADRRWWWTAAALTGLGMANQISTALLVPVWLFWSLLRQKRLPLGAIALGALFLITGLTLYLYLPLRAWQQPAINEGDPGTWPRFLAHVTAQRYRGYVLALSLSQRLLRMQQAMRVTSYQVGGLWPLALLGWAWSAWNWRSFWWMGMGMALVIMACFVAYDVPDVWTYFLPFYWLTALWAAWGVACLWSWSKVWGRMARGGMRAALWSWVTIAIAWQVIALQGFHNLKGETYPRDVARQILGSLPEGSHLLVKDDEILFSLWYLQHALGERKDVVTQGFYQFLLPEVVRQVRAAIDRGLRADRPLYTTFWGSFLEGQAYRNAQGPVCALLPSPSPIKWDPPQGEVIPYLVLNHSRWSSSVAKRGAMLTLTIDWSVPSVLPQPWTVRAVFRCRDWREGLDWQQMAQETRGDKSFEVAWETQYIPQIYGWTQSWHLAQGRPLIPPVSGAHFHEGYPVQIPPPTLSGEYDAYLIAYPSVSRLPPPDRWSYVGSFEVFALKPTRAWGEESR